MFVFVFAKKLTRISLAIVLIPGPLGNTKLAHKSYVPFHLASHPSITLIPLKRVLLFLFYTQNYLTIFQKLSRP